MFVLAVDTGVVVIVVAVAVVLVVLFVTATMRGRRRSEEQLRGEARYDVSEAQERADRQRERDSRR
jgi:hypothetical protein